MKSNQELLAYYGRCCIREHGLRTKHDYSAEEYERLRAQEDIDLAFVQGEKKVIEWMFANATTPK